MLSENIGVVVIGRNEGERLKKCLHSAIKESSAVVYVDSGSVDSSVEFAESIGVKVLELDMSMPFTAARARNEGFGFLLLEYPELEYVQFVDGDCEFIAGWFASALSSFEQDEGDAALAVVFGLRKERFPNESVYNYQADKDWQIEPGYTDTCGGDALMVVSALNEVGGYDASLIAGEEPDLCLRLRRAGWSILCVSVDMTWHDSNLHSFYQWYKRGVRTGHAFAEISWKHRGYSERYWVRHNIRILGWGLLLPIFIMFLSIFNIAFLSMFLVYPLQVARIATKEGWVYACFCVFVKFPQVVGQLKYIINLYRGKASTLIEYK